MLAFMRRMVGDAGHVERLYSAVRNSAESAVDNERYQWERFRRKYSGTGTSKFPTLGSPRSAEPHIAFARELGLLEHRSAGGRWLLTPGAGKAFLELWDTEEHRPPVYFLLSQLLRYDRTLLLPFLHRILDDENGPVAIARVWEQMWRLHRSEMAALEPPVPTSLWHDSGHPLKRTAKHHSDSRLRFLVKEEGLHLGKDQLKRLVDSFWDLREARLPSDRYFRIGWAVEGIHPDPISEESTLQWALKAFSRLRHGTYVSAASAFGFINELILPKQGLGWDEFSTMLRSDEAFTIHPSLQPGDVLYGSKSPQAV